MDIIPEPAWEFLLQEIKKKKGVALIIGATDSGKSTLTCYLLSSLVADGMHVCLIDSDVGQSSLGIPGSISMKAFSTVKELEDFMFDKMFFIGVVNPSRRIHTVVSTVKKATDYCRRSADITLIDTCGLIAGETGISLKIGKIRAIQPRHVIALQKHNELEHILELTDTAEIHRISASLHTRTRTMAMRSLYRRMKFEEYFSKTKMNDFLLHANEARFLYDSRSFLSREGCFKKDTLIGLNHESETIALGILDDITGKSITFRSPIQSIKSIDTVLFGDIILER